MGGSLKIGEVLLTKCFFGFPTFVETPKIKSFCGHPVKKRKLIHTHNK